MENQPANTEGGSPSVNVNVDIEELPPPAPPVEVAPPVVTEPVVIGETPRDENEIAYRLGRLEGLINDCIKEQAELSERMDTYIESHIAVHETQDTEIESLESSLEQTQEAVTEIGEEVMPDGEKRPTPLWCRLLGAK